MDTAGRGARLGTGVIFIADNFSTAETTVLTHVSRLSSLALTDLSPLTLTASRGILPSSAAGMTIIGSFLESIRILILVTSSFAQGSSAGLETVFL
jgi:hypothetical protein